MAADPDALGLEMAAAIHQDMLDMVEEEKRLRKLILDRVRNAGVENPDCQEYAMAEKVGGNKNLGSRLELTLIFLHN